MGYVWPSAALTLAIAVPAWADTGGGGDDGKDEDTPRESSSEGTKEPDPLQEIRRLMEEVESRLAELMPDEETQKKQDEIVERIDKIIEDAGGT